MSMAREKAEFLKGTLDRLIVRAVGAGALQGYAISPRIQRICKDFLQVPQGALYPAPHRLEERGLEAEWRATATGREAKPYKLRHEGGKQLDSEMLDWEMLTDAVALILRTA